jgi:hypothetical protein
LPIAHGGAIFMKSGSENIRPVQRDFHFAFTHGHSTSPRRKRSPRRSPASRELALRVRSDF